MVLPALALALTLSRLTVATAAPFVPSDDGLVLERLPYSPLDPTVRELRRMRAELAREPHNVDLAIRLARRYIELGRAESDPRYFGHAEGVLQPWWHRSDPPRPCWSCAPP